MNNWQKLCEHMNSYIKDNVLEGKYHSNFKVCLKTIFNWDNIKIEEPVHMGSATKYADIVLKGSDFGIVIEMKRPDNKLVSGEEEAQLTSYMRILKYKYGLLIGNIIKVFFDDDTIGSKPIEVASINFDDNNPDGIALSEILDMDVCSNDKLYEYVNIRIERIRNAERVEILKNDLLSNNYQKIKNILRDKLISDGEKDEVVSKVIDVVFTNYGKNRNPHPPEPIGVGTENKPPDRGIIDTNNERVQRIEDIRHKGYISTDDRITFPTIIDVLNNLFDKKLAGWMKAVFPKVYDDIDAWFPKLDYYIKNGERRPGCKHWHNYFLNNNQNLLVEYPTKACDLKTLKWPPEEPVKKWRSYVFAKHEGFYQFFGIFEQDRISTAGQLGLTIEINPDEPVMVFNRLNKEGKLPEKKW